MPGPALSPALRDEILRRLAAAEPIARIARELGVSRMTVRRLARGAHVSQQPDHRCYRPGPNVFVRCAGCGAKVQEPCQACLRRRGL